MIDLDDRISKPFPICPRCRYGLNGRSHSSHTVTERQPHTAADITYNVPTWAQARSLALNDFEMTLPLCAQISGRMNDDYEAAERHFWKTTLTQAHMHCKRPGVLTYTYAQTYFHKDSKPAHAMGENGGFLLLAEAVAFSCGVGQ